MTRLKSVHAGTETGARLDQTEQEFRYGWIDAHAAVTHLGLGSVNALYRAIAELGCPFGRVGRHYRFRRYELDQWMERRGAAIQKAS